MAFFGILGDLLGGVTGKIIGKSSHFYALFSVPRRDVVLLHQLADIDQEGIRQFQQGRDPRLCAARFPPRDLRVGYAQRLAKRGLGEARRYAGGPNACC